MNAAQAPQTSESTWKSFHTAPIDVESGATRACFVLKQNQESKDRKSASSKIEIDSENSRFFYQKANRITFRDYNTISVTDFARHRFFENRPLAWRCREFV